MATLKGTRTLTNLMGAFAGESQARNRYSFFAQIAREEGYNRIADIFQENSDNEMAHAQLHMQMMKDGLDNADLPHMVEITGSFPVVYGTTEQNLQASVDGEGEEADDMYPEFAKIAAEEGFPKIAAKFRMIGEIERAHQMRFQKLLKEVQDNKVFARDEKTLWKCSICGYIAEAVSAPEKCPVCWGTKKDFDIKYV